MSKTDKQKDAVLNHLRSERGSFISPALATIEVLKGKANKTATAEYIFRALQRDGLVEINKEGWAKAI